MKKLLVKLVAVLVLLVLAGGVSACMAKPETTSDPGKSVGAGVANEAQAIEIAKERFEEYLKEKPEMNVKDPVYTAVKKTDSKQAEYWSVTIELQEPEYKLYYYEVQISVDGDKVTMATG